MAASIKSVLFDLDGTLLDRRSSLRRFAHWQASGMLRREISDPEVFCERFTELDGNGGVLKNEVYSQLVDLFDIRDWSVAELTRSYDLCFSGFCRPKEGVVNAVSALQSMGFILGVVSNGRSPFQERNFHALGMSELFEVLIVSGSVGLRKPDRRIFELATGQTGIAAKDTAFVGDNPEADIDGANACGMYTVYIPGHFGQTCNAADATCAHYDHLVDLIRYAR